MTAGSVEGCSKSLRVRMQSNPMPGEEKQGQGDSEAKRRGAVQGCSRRLAEGRRIVEGAENETGT